MKSRYFEDTDTLYLELRNSAPVRTKQINENVLLELDSNGKVVGLTIQHIKQADGLITLSPHHIVSEILRKIQRKILPQPRP